MYICNEKARGPKRREHVKQYKKEWYLKHKEQLKQRYKEYQKNHREHIKQYHKEWYQLHREQWRQCSKERYRKHREQIRQHEKEYYQKHKEQMNQKNKEYWQKHTEQLIQHGKQYYQNHREQINQYQKEYWQNHVEQRSKIQRRAKAKRRNLSFIPLNQYFDGSHAHHVDRSHVIYVPAKLHASMKHCVWTGRNMENINAKVFEWLEQQTRTAPLVITSF